MPDRWTQADVRSFALSLPETYTGSHMGRSDIRVRNRIFLTLPDDGGTVNLKSTPLAVDMAVHYEPAVYRDVWGGRWVGVALAEIEVSLLRGLVIDAYCLAAPGRLAAAVRASEAQDSS